MNTHPGAWFPSLLRTSRKLQEVIAWPKAETILGDEDLLQLSGLVFLCPRCPKPMTGPVSSSIPRAPPPPCQSSGWRMEAIPVGTTWGQKRGHEPIPRVEFGSENTGCRNIKGAWSRQGGSLSQQEPTGAEGSTAQPTRSGQFRWKQCRSMGFPGGSVVKNLPAMQELQETWVRSLGLEDPLEEGMTTHSSILAWRIP